MPLSYSQLQSYRTCPRQYEYAYVKKLARGISPGESFGSSIHNTLKKWGELEQEVGRQKTEGSEGQLTLFIDAQEEKKPAENLTMETLLTLWHRSFIVEGYASRMEADHNRTRGETILRHFYDWWNREERDVVGVETGFRYRYGEDNAILTGRLDRAERTKDGLTIIDFKSTRPREQESVDADLQLSIYALAARELWNEPVHTLVLLFLNEEGVTERTTERNASQLRDAQASIRALTERIAGKDYSPTPERERCKRCPYRTVCDVAAV